MPGIEARNTAGYESPIGLTADPVVFTLLDGALCVLLARRLEEPQRGMFALPGGFVGADESPSQTAERKLREKTGVGSAQAPEITSRPSGRNAAWQACTSSGRPTHSMATSYPATSASATDSRTSVAPVAFANSRRRRSGSTTVTRTAPFSSAQTNVVSPTPPAPTITTSSPEVTSALCTPCNPTAKGSTRAA